MKRAFDERELDTYPTRRLRVEGGFVTEILVPETRKAEVLAEFYPFEKAPGLDEEMYDSRAMRAFRVRDYKIVCAEGIRFLVSPYFPKGGGSVIDWTRRPNRRGGGVDVHRASVKATASITGPDISRQMGEKAHGSVKSVILCLFLLLFAVLTIFASERFFTMRVDGWGPDPDGVVSDLVSRADIDDLRLLSRLGDAEASYELARRLEEGHGVERDAAAAGHQYLVAEEQGIDLPQSVIDRLNL